MLLEFVTSPAGHLINTGFQIKADTILLESGDSKPIEVPNSTPTTFSLVCDSHTGCCSLTTHRQEEQIDHLITFLSLFHHSFLSSNLTDFATTRIHS